jgi:hypothetical protein
MSAHPGSRPPFLAAALAGLLAAACTSTAADTHCCDTPDLTVEQAHNYGQAEMGAPPVSDLRLGTGRVVQEARQVTLVVDARDRANRPVGDATIVFFAGSTRFLPGNLSYGGYSPGHVPPEFVGAVSGMRVGGRRRFTMAETGCGQGRLPCGLFGSGPTGAAIRLPAGSPVTFTVDAMAVCRPRIVLVTQYGIPADKHTTAVERSCD